MDRTVAVSSKDLDHVCQKNVLYIEQPKLYSCEEYGTIHTCCFAVRFMSFMLLSLSSIFSSRSCKAPARAFIRTMQFLTRRTCSNVCLET